MRHILFLIFSLCLLSPAAIAAAHAPKPLNTPGVRSYQVEKTIPSWSYQTSLVAGKSRLRLDLPEDLLADQWVKAVTTPIEGAIPAGAEVTVAFWARIAPPQGLLNRTFADTPPTYAYVAFRSQDRTQINRKNGQYYYRRHAGKAFTLTDQWQLYTTHIRLKKAIPEKGGALALYLSGKGWAVDLGPSYVLPGTSAAAVKAINIPYTVRDIAVHAKGTDLSATFTAPSDPGRHPAIVLENEAGCYPRTSFDYLTDQLLKIGFATMVYQRRECSAAGKKAGDKSALLAVRDLSHVVRRMKHLPEVDADKSGLLAVGKGALIAQYAAANGPEVHFLAMLNPMAMDARAASARVLQSLLPLYPDTSKQQAIKAAFRDAMYVMTHNRHKKAAERALKRLSHVMARPDAPAKEIYEKALAPLLKLRFLLPFDSRLNLAHISAPMLVLKGGNDLRIPSKRYAVLFHRALKDDPKSRIITLPGRDHFFLSSKLTQFHGKWRINPPPFSDAAMLEILTNWLIHVNGLDSMRMD